MASDMTASLPERLRSRRKALGLTLRDVADEARLSVGFISQIERGLATPSLTSLVEIARALALDPGALLGIPPTSGATLPQAGRNRFALSPLGPTYERISSGDGRMALNGLVTHFPPGYASAETTRHEGEELFYVLEGELELVLDGTRTRLRPGDAAHYSSALPHHMRNPTDKPTSILWVGTINLFGAEANHAPEHRALTQESLDQAELEGAK
ncbi:MAG: cupin domain-containing protein [Alphaproteobacteria bacterium]